MPSVIGISVDSHYVLAKYKAEQELNFTLLSDFNKETSIAYQSIYEVFSYGMKGVSKRSAFVIDRKGIDSICRSFGECRGGSRLQRDPGSISKS